MIMLIEDRSDEVVHYDYDDDIRGLLFPTARTIGGVPVGLKKNKRS